MTRLSSIVGQVNSASKTSNGIRTDLAGFSVFLTAYDPSDLPGGSLDPLGFERGYLLLADKILPGLTNVADRPRYFSILCAGASLADVDLTHNPRTQYERRLECILRFERFWALANVLASRSSEDGELTSGGIRGVTYVSNRAEAIESSGIRRVDANYQLLSRQIPYGVVGIYGAVAEGMRFLDRTTFALTPDLGERLAEGFLENTDTPKALIKAIRDNGDVSIETLTEWGRRAHINGQHSSEEQHCMHDALHREPVRSRMTEVMKQVPFESASDTELNRFGRMLPLLARSSSNTDLHESVLTIRSYESCYQLAMLAFERLLWLGRNLQSGSISPTDISNDPVFKLVYDRLPAATQRLTKCLDEGKTPQFQMNSERLLDTRQFLEQAAACSGPQPLVQVILERHSEVQRGKFDRGRKKMPWLEQSAGRISLTMTRVGGLKKQVTSPTELAPHPYRLSSADAMIFASEAT